MLPYSITIVNAVASLIGHVRVLIYRVVEDSKYLVYKHCSGFTLMCVRLLKERHDGSSVFADFLIAMLFANFIKVSVFVDVS